MIRENKFRVWDLHCKYFIYFDFSNPMFDDDYNTISFNCNNVMGERGGIERFKFQQFTGLLDKNGKECFEGDIISTPYFIMGKDSGSKEIKKVVFYKGMFGVFGSNAYSFIELNGLYTGKEETKKYVPNFGEIYEETEAVFEVIGNIYENPDLLSNN